MKYIFAIAPVLFLANLAASQDLVNVKEQAWVAKVQYDSLDTTGHTFHLSVTGPAIEEFLQFGLRPQIFTLKDPVRLVVDFPRLEASGYQTFSVSDKHVRAFRVGRHPDKIRLVVDFRGDLVPGFAVETSRSAFDIRVVVPKSETITQAEAQPEQQKHPVVAVEKSEEKPVSGPKLPIPRVRPLVVPIPEDPAKEPITIPREPAPIVKPPVEDLRPEPTPKVGPGFVDAVLFSNYGTPPVSSLRIDAIRVEYELTRKKDNLYVLVLKRAKLSDPSLLLPQFPPEGFGGFEVVVAREDGEDVVLDIFVEQGVQLKPFLARNSLWIQPTQ